MKMIWGTAIKARTTVRTAQAELTMIHTITVPTQMITSYRPLAANPGREGISNNILALGGFIRITRGQYIEPT